MEAPFKKVQDQFATLLMSAVSTSYPKLNIIDQEVELSISIPKSEYGDLSSSIAFKIAKLANANPKGVADQLLKKIKKGELFSDIKNHGGYINASINTQKYAKLVLRETMKQEGYGRSEIGNGIKVLIESPSVNPNKPILVSHLRNALLGDSLSNAYEFCSYNVERENYIDDLGLQMTESVWGYINLDKHPTKRIDLWLGEQYVKVNEYMKKNDITNELKRIAKQMEIQGSDMSNLARKLAEKCVKAQYDTLFNYGIYHNVLIWESDIVRAKLLEKAMDLVKKKGVVEKPTEGKYANAVIVNLAKATDLPKELEGSLEEAKVLTRSTGVATYVAKDMAFHMWKFGVLDADFKYTTFIKRQPSEQPLFSTSKTGKNMQFGKTQTVINIIGTEQKYEQSILRLIFDLAGYDNLATNLIHLAYGWVNIEGGSLSTREGGWMGKQRSYTADDLLDETTLKAIEIVSSSDKIKNRKDIKQISREVAIGAIKFEFLRVSPEKEIVFSWEKALDFESNSGPYCMYTHARATRILEKENVPARLSDADYKQITKGVDFELIKLIGNMQTVVEKTCAENRPNVLTTYLIELSATFSRFYESMPVLKGEKAKNLRLAITDATRQTLANGLELLGITPLERM